MLNRGFGKRILQTTSGGGGGGGVDADYQAILDFANAGFYTLPSAGQQTKQNALLTALKSAGIWSRLDALYVFATNGDANFATLNWKNPNTYQAGQTNSPAFTANRGFKGDGATSYLTTGINPTTGNFNYSQNNASRFAWVTTGFSVNSYIDGLTTLALNRTANTSTSAHRINGSTLSVAANLGSTGLKAINRIDANNINMFSNTTGTSATGASATMSNESQNILRAATNFGDPEIGIYGIGSALFSFDTHNFLTFSEQMDNAIWTKTNATVTADATTAPDSNSTADKLLDAATASTHTMAQTAQSFPVGTYTVSIYAKAAEYNRFRLSQTNTEAFYVEFNLTGSGSIATTSGATGTITDVGGGWYRCSITFTTTTAHLLNCVTFLHNGTSTNFTGTGTSGIYFWGSQLEIGSNTSTYIPTTTNIVNNVTALNTGLYNALNTYMTSI